MTARARLLLLVAAVVILVGGFVIARGAGRRAGPVGGGGGGEPQGGVKRLTFEKGDRIRFRVVSDVADEVHVHGYDIHADVEAGGRATLSFDATIEGRFEVELEGRGTEIVELEVTP